MSEEMHRILNKSVFLAWLLICCRDTVAFPSNHHRHGQATPRNTPRSSQLSMIGYFGGGSTRIPTSAKDRDNQAVQAVKAAVAKPKMRNFRLVECEFPALAALNKLGDGSMQSANQVEDANLQTAVLICRALSTPLGLGPQACLVISGSATARLTQRARRAYSSVHSLREDGGISADEKNKVFVLVAPSGRDYQLAQQLASDGATVVLVNGFAKDNKSIPAQATMAYYNKPLTYNSQVAGYLLRTYPSPWTTIDAVSRAVLGTATDDEILVPNTNTPDLRASVKLVQRAVDARAIAARNR